MIINKRLQKRYQFIGSLNPRYVSMYILGWMGILLLIIIGRYEYRINDLRNEIATINTMNHSTSTPYRDIPLDHDNQKIENDGIIPWFDKPSNRLPPSLKEFFETDDFLFPLPWLESRITGTTQTFQQTRITPDGTISRKITITPPTIQGTASLPSNTTAQSMYNKLIELGIQTNRNNNTLSFSGTLNDVEKLRRILGF